MTRLIAFALALWAAAGLAAAYPAPPRDVNFKVYRGGDEIGYHRVRFTQDGPKTVADVDIELSVYVAFVRVFHYRHLSREIWQDGRLDWLDSSTYDDGQDMSLKVRREGDVLLIDGTRYQGEADGALLPTSYWFLDTIKQSQLIDSQNGRIFPVTIADLGPATVEIAGQQIPTRHYRLTGELALDLWYDETGQWVRSSFDARGAEIVYELQPQPARAAAAP